MRILRIILGVFLPPLGVFMTTGVSSALLINILLTLLGVIPGSIHAIWVIVKHEQGIAEEGGTY